jgi:hypothetical protein
MRADLWNPARAVAAQGLPTPGDMLKSAKEDFDGLNYDREWSERAKKTMW